MEEDDEALRKKNGNFAFKLNSESFQMNRLCGLHRSDGSQRSSISRIVGKLLIIPGQQHLHYEGLPGLRGLSGGVCAADNAGPTFQCWD